MRITAFQSGVSLLAARCVISRIPSAAGLGVDHHDLNHEVDPKVADSVQIYQRRQLTAKPEIYTFFNELGSGSQSDGLSNSADEQMLQTWREEWSRAGWKPVILSLKTAQRHPDYDTMKLIIDGPFAEFDRYCFLRWLAFAVVGGGFAADYDTLPLEFLTTTLPNGGNLTVHESSDRGGVPSIVSATADEYTWFAWSLARSVVSHRNESHWSDMKAMQDLYQSSNGTAYIMESNVLSAVAVLHGRGIDERTCARVAGKHALHFSQHALRSGKVEDRSGASERAAVGAEWLAGWRIVCLNSSSSIFQTPISTDATKEYPGDAINAVSGVGQDQGAPLEHANNAAESKQPEPTPKPTILTFFTPVSNKQHTGMSDETDDYLLQTWKDQWSRAGWKPVVLTADAAKQHADFETINAMLDGPFGEYDRYCFLRWLAFAVGGGGFVADYDTFPLRFVTNTLPNGGKITIHEQSKAGGVPSLVSATADEYTRFAWSLAGTVPSHKNESHWSDMKAMQHIYQKSNKTAYLMEGNAMSAFNVLTGQEIDVMMCELVMGKYALHFSHYAIEFGKVPIGSGAKDRANIGRQWLERWQNVCDNQINWPPTGPEAKMKAASDVRTHLNNSKNGGDTAASVDTIFRVASERSFRTAQTETSRGISDAVAEEADASRGNMYSPTAIQHAVHNHLASGLSPAAEEKPPQAGAVDLAKSTPTLASDPEVSQVEDRGHVKNGQPIEVMTERASVSVESKALATISGNIIQNSASHLSETVDKPHHRRPLIYTFVGQPDISTMSQDDQAMLTVWLISWYEIGWEPRVLWLNSAEKHYGFHALSTLLNRVSSNISPNFFLRFLAMANVGGGWYSDYDLMPLDKVPASHHQLPNEGKLTIHEAKKINGVPSLVSGRSEEYTRISNELSANALAHVNEPFWSESLALQELYQSGSGQRYFLQSNIVSVEGLPQGHGFDPGSCTTLDQKYAVHVTNEFVSRSEIVDFSQATNSRKWVLEWRRACLGEGKVPVFQ